MKKIIISTLKAICLGGVLTHLLVFYAVAAPLPTGQDRVISDQQLINQQERQKAIEE